MFLSFLSLSSSYVLKIAANSVATLYVYPNHILIPESPELFTGLAYATDVTKSIRVFGDTRYSDLHFDGSGFLTIENNRNYPLEFKYFLFGHSCSSNIIIRNPPDGHYLCKTTLNELGECNATLSSNDNTCYFYVFGENEYTINFKYDSNSEAHYNFNTFSYSGSEEVSFSKSLPNKFNSTTEKLSGAIYVEMSAGSYKANTTMSASFSIDKQVPNFSIKRQYNILEVNPDDHYYYRYYDENDRYFENVNEVLIGIAASISVVFAILLIASSLCFTILHTNIMTDISEKVDKSPEDIAICKSEILQNRSESGMEVIINP